MTITLAQVPQVNSSCGQEGGGRSGKAPTPYSATDNLHGFGAGRAWRVRACAPPRQHALRRNTHTRAGRSGSIGRSAEARRQAALLLLCARGISPLAWGDVCETRAQTVRLLRGGTCQSRSICCLGRVVTEFAPHTHDNYGTPPRLAGRAFSCADPYNGRSNTCDVCGCRARQRRTQRNADEEKGLVP